MSRPPAILYVHFGPVTDADYRELGTLLTQFTPIVQTCPPDAALADLTGALRLFDRDAASLAAVLRLRITALFGDTTPTLGLGPNPLLARIAAADGAPGTLRTAPTQSDQAAAYLAPMPLGRLPGCGPATVRTLNRFGLTTIGQLAATPTATLIRILGTSAARHLHDAAHGIDHTPVQTAAPAASISAEHRFARDELDASLQHRALLALADEVGLRLRASRQIARTLTLTVHYADRSTTSRTRTLPEPTAHGAALIHAAHTALSALALQRARVRALTLRAERLAPAGAATTQLTLDPSDDRARRLEAVTDRLRSRFGHHVVRPAAAWI